LAVADFGPTGNYRAIPLARGAFDPQGFASKRLCTFIRFFGDLLCSRRNFYAGEVFMFFLEAKSSGLAAPALCPSYH
jgi:hypothetical protein